MIDALELKLKNNPLLYRQILTISEHKNFGLELELDKVDPNEVYTLVRNKFGESWIVKNDNSLTKGKNAEITSPVLHNNKQTWILLKKMGELLEKLKPSYDKCSFQINFDGNILPSIEDKISFLKLYAMYEDIIYRFSKGEDLEYRESLDIYASPIILALKGSLSLGDESTIMMFSNNKRYGISFKNETKDLIEFRTPNMTSNPILWQNYITLFYYLLEFASNNKQNKKEVDEYINKFYKMYILDSYSIERKEKAIQLTKKIFPNSTDQIYFLHQYLDNGNIHNK